MSTQYNTIQEPYDEIRKCSIAMIERQNVREALQPFIKGARVLDLACGSGFYTTEFVGWGAHSVVGVDISASMLSKARREIDSTKLGSQITLIEADCAQPKGYPGGPFDVVFGAWLLNYAPDSEQLSDLFRNIALNLTEDGHFVGVTPPPTQDPVAFYEAENHARPHGSGLLMGHPTGLVTDGAAVHMHADTELGAVDFDFFHLTKDVYEETARDGGLAGKIQWHLTKVPDGFSGEGGASEQEIESYKSTPNYAVLVIKK